MNTFGNIFRISIFGESHSNFIGITIDGCPSGLLINSDDFVVDINRRKPQIMAGTKRIEEDKATIVSGVLEGKTTGSPLTILFQNNDVNSTLYSSNKIRPGHSDYVAKIKYDGFNDYRGGGMFSGRMTIALVAAGVVAKKICKYTVSDNLDICSKIISIGGILNDDEHSSMQSEYISVEIRNFLNNIEQEGDSAGGVIECVIKNVPIGLGEPFFDSMESLISHLIFSISGIKGIEFGKGFEFAKLKGSQANDCYIGENGETATNNSGGINAGISNGNEIIFRVVIRPTPSIKKSQRTFNFETNRIDNIQVDGRHDICFALRMPVIIEAAVAIVLADLSLIRLTTRK
jgi:chorismate synthase